MRFFALSGASHRLNPLIPLVSRNLPSPVIKNHTQSITLGTGSIHKPDNDTTAKHCVLEFSPCPHTRSSIYWMFFRSRREVVYGTALMKKFVHRDEYKFMQ